MTELRYESFTVPGEPGTFDQRGAEYIRAIDYGFLEHSRSDELLTAQLDRFRSEGTLLTGAYDDAQDPRSLEAARPVATFGDFVGSVCVREGVTVPAQMITDVSVRGTHRRRGILSHLMRGALARAHRDGLALSLLTASEGGIYGRYGFGAAAYSQRVTVRAHHGLRLRADVRAALAGITVIVPTWDSFAAGYAEVYPAFQRATIGQVGNTHAYRRRAAGSGNGWALHGVDNDFRPLMAIDASGAVVGFALAQGHPATHTITVADLGAVSVTAELALWDALAATDLVHEVVWAEAPLDTALTWALEDLRDVAIGARSDHLWARVLDIPAAFAARGLATDGALSLTVSDREGFIDGTWVITRTAGQTSAARGAVQPAHITLDAETLGSLYLGTVSVTTLANIGRITADDLPTLESLLPSGPAPRNSYTF